MEELGHAIVTGQLSPDEVIDAAWLEQSLGVSRTVVREALRVLAAKGLVDARPKRGTFVRPRSGWQLFDADVLRWGFSAHGSSSLNALSEVRRIVEPAIAALAAARRDDDDLAALEAALAHMAGAKTRDETTAADLSFHRGLALASHNELLGPIQEVILVGLRERDLVVHTSTDGEEGVRLHRDVLDAVRGRRPVEAETAMRHLLDVAAHDASATVADPVTTPPSPRGSGFP